MLPQLEEEGGRSEKEGREEGVPNWLNAKGSSKGKNSSVHQVIAKLVKLMEIDGVGQCMCRDEAHTLQLKLRSLEDCRRYADDC